jgi:hypothetical protein
VLYILCGSLLIAQEQVSTFSIGGISFHIPSLQEASDYFSLVKYLGKVDKGEVRLGAEKWNQMLFRYSNEDTLSSYALRYFLPIMKNSENRKIIEKLHEESSFSGPVYELCHKMYNSRTIRASSKEAMPQIRHEYENEYDEGFDFFTIKEQLLYNRELGIVLLSNNAWYSLSFSNGAKEKDFTVLTGGQTQAMSLFSKKYYVTEEEFVSTVKKESINDSVDDNQGLYELNIEGVLTKANCDRAFISCSYDSDHFDGQIFLYNRNKKLGYQFHTNCLISSLNFYYPTYERLWNMLLENLTLVWIE